MGSHNSQTLLGLPLHPFEGTLKVELVCLPRRQDPGSMAENLQMRLQHIGNHIDDHNNWQDVLYDWGKPGF